MESASCMIGIDLGIKDLLITSNGEKFDNIHTIKKYEDKLAKEQRKLSHKVKGSKNWNKQRIKVARIHEKIRNTRIDNSHKISHKLVSENQVIVSEDLAVSNMIKNRNLAKAISDCGWYELTRQLTYKADWNNRQYIKIGRFTKSSQNYNGCIGIDVVIKEFYSDSNGNVVSNPKYLEKSMCKLIREQRKLSRKQKNSNNRNKQRVKVALVHEKITNQRNDFLQKQSTMLIRENQTICIEDLKVKNMMCNHKLAQHIGSASWSKFFDMLTYKSVWYGNEVIKVPTMYPSSQTCSCCGYKNPLVKNLSIRVWECPNCHAVHNRDTNASINILNKGLQIQPA